MNIHYPREVAEMNIHYLGGMPQAGSTLLCQILNQNPACLAPPSSGLITLFAESRTNLTQLPEFKWLDREEQARAFSGFTRGSILAWCHSVRDILLEEEGEEEGEEVRAPRDPDHYFDKSRGWVGYLEMLWAAFPGAKVVVPVRDIRGALSSMEKDFRANPQLETGLQNAAAMQNLTVEQRVTTWLNSPPLGVSLLRIKEALQRGYKDRLHFIRYEELCGHPAGALADLYAYLGAEPYAHDFEDIPPNDLENDSVYAGVGASHKVEKAVRPAARDWNQFIGKGLAGQVVLDNPWFYEAFYPDI